MRIFFPSRSLTTAGAALEPGCKRRSDIHLLSSMVGGGGGSLPVWVNGVAPERKLFDLSEGACGGAGGTSLAHRRSSVPPSSTAHAAGPRRQVAAKNQRASELHFGPA